MWWIVALSLCAVTIALVWRFYLSAPIIDSTEIGTIKHRGKPVTEIRGGKTVVKIWLPGDRPFVPWIPIKFPGGYYLYELVRIPTKPQSVSYDLPEDTESFWTSDNIRVRGQVIMYVAFPTSDPEAVLCVLTSGVPTTVRGIKKFFEEFVMSKSRRVIAKSTHTDITGGKDSLKKDILEIFKDKKSLPRRCGLYGKDPDNDDPGTGYVDVDMEQIELDEDLRRKYGEKVTARIDIDIAESKAAAAAHNAGVVPKAYAEWLKTDEGKAASEDMKAVVFEAIRQGKLSADGHYTEQISRNLIGSPDGSPLPSGLTYLSLGGGGGGGVLFSGKGNKGNPGGNPGGQGNPPGGQKSPEEAAQEYFDKFQKWPTWWDPVNKKVV